MDHAQDVCFFRPAAALLYSIYVIALISLANTISAIPRNGSKEVVAEMKFEGGFYASPKLFIDTVQPHCRLMYLLFPHLSFLEYGLRLRFLASAHDKSADGESRSPSQAL